MIDAVEGKLQITTICIGIAGDNQAREIRDVASLDSPYPDNTGLKKYIGSWQPKALKCKRILKNGCLPSIYYQLKAKMKIYYSLVDYQPE